MALLALVPSVPSPMNGLPLPQPFLKDGSWIQVYRDKIPGATTKQKIEAAKPKLDLLASLGARGLVVHGFTKEMTPDVFGQWASASMQFGLPCAAAWGLDDTDPEGKGRRMGEVAKGLNCSFTLFDQEGAYDQEDDAPKAEATAQAFFATAGADAIVGDQPWPITHVHSSFPWKVTAKYMVFRAPQYYCNDWKKQYGKDSYEKVFAWANKDWAKREQETLPVKPRLPTIQGYSWDLDDCVTCLMTYPQNVVWCEPWPEDLFLTAMMVRQKLLSLGFSGVGAVAAFQASARLTVDGSCGAQTLRALGITPYDSSNVVTRSFRRLGAMVGAYTYPLAA